MSAGVEALARLMFDAYQEGIHELYPDSEVNEWDALNPSSRSLWLTAAQVLIASDWLAAQRAEGEVRGQMMHISAEVARGDQPLEAKEELIADLRARLSHMEAERDEQKERADWAVEKGIAWRNQLEALQAAAGALATEFDQRADLADKRAVDGERFDPNAYARRVVYELVAREVRALL